MQTKCQSIPPSLIVSTPAYSLCIPLPRPALPVPCPTLPCPTLPCPALSYPDLHRRSIVLPCPASSKCIRLNQQCTKHLLGRMRPNRMHKAFASSDESSILSPSSAPSPSTSIPDKRQEQTSCAFKRRTSHHDSYRSTHTTMQI